MAELERAASERAALGEGEFGHILRAPTSKRQAIDGIAAALGFPSWFGGNLDALFDCLIDLSWLAPGTHVLVWTEPERLRGSDAVSYDALSAALADAINERGKRRHGVRLRAVLVD